MLKNKFGTNGKNNPIQQINCIQHIPDAIAGPTPFSLHKAVMAEDKSSFLNGFVEFLSFSHTITRSIHLY